jgi:hypothetical protein
MKGYYHSTGTVQEISLDSHPISYQQVGKNVWMQHLINLSLLTSSKNPPPGHLINNTLTNPTTERLIIGSNGYLHLQDQVAAAAWNQGLYLCPQEYVSLGIPAKIYDRIFSWRAKKY